MFDYEYWGNEILPAHHNMALEEFFLKRAAFGKAIVRFFSFPRDCVVLGYSQANDPVKTLDKAFDVARRITGGSHVQTGENIIAYSFAVPRDGSFRNYEDMRNYYAAHVANALSDMGIANIEVDNKASTINADGKIIAAHALIWGVQSALLHGLILIDSYDADTLANRVFLQKRRIGSKTYSEYAALKNLPSISGMLDKMAVNASDRTEALKKILSDAILKRVTNTYERKIINQKTVIESYQLMKNKFGQNEWVDNRKPAFAKQEVECVPDAWQPPLDGELKRKLGYCLFLQVKDRDFKKMCGPD